MKRAVRIALLVTLFGIGSFGAAVVGFGCCGNPCWPGVNCKVDR